MLLPLSWLKEIVPLKDTPEKIAEKLLLSGTKVEEIKKVGKETVFELEITPNRPDTLSILGVAREAAAQFGKELILPSTDTILPLKSKSGSVEFKVKDKKLAPYYSIVKLGQIKIESSPSWIKDYLQLAGIRAINNVVDITNYIMLETGQPMHAFDAKKVKGGLVVRAATKDEAVTTLDGVERKLNEGAIIIEDKEKLIDLAGLMGGENSEIDKNTSEIILLVPVYDPVAIRKTSIFTNLRTEASNRFEKKLDPNMHVFAVARAVKLFAEIVGASQESSVLSVGYPVKNKVIDLPLNLVRDILGLQLEHKDIINLLSPLEFKVKMSNLKDATAEIEIPSFRTDVSITEDILEEIARSFGYNNFPKTLPNGPIPLQPELFEPENENFTREYFLENSFNESTGYSLVSEKDLINITLAKTQALAVLHPTSSDFVYLRPSLLINLLKAIASNQSMERTSFFEIAKEFHPEIDKQFGLPLQRTTLAAITDQNFSFLKGIIETYLNKFSLDLTEKEIKNISTWKDGIELYLNNVKIATIGLIDKKILDNFEIASPLAAAQVNFEFLRRFPLVERYKPLPKFPSITEDISFFIPTETKINPILKTIENFDKLVGSVKIVDTFIKDSKKSFTLRINYSSKEKTLTSKEVEKIRRGIEKRLEQKFLVQIRRD